MILPRCTKTRAFWFACTHASRLHTQRLMADTRRSQCGESRAGPNSWRSSAHTYRDARADCAHTPAETLGRECFSILSASVLKTPCWSSDMLHSIAQSDMDSRRGPCGRAPCEAICTRVPFATPKPRSRPILGTSEALLSGGQPCSVLRCFPSLTATRHCVGDPVDWHHARLYARGSQLPLLSPGRVRSPERPKPC